MVLARLAVCGIAVGFAVALRRIRNPIIASVGVLLISLALAGCFILGVSIKQQGAEFRSATIIALMLIYPTCRSACCWRQRSR